MTRSQKLLITKLLKGHFLRRVERSRRLWYVLYDEKINPLVKIQERTVKSIDVYYDPKKKMKLWKRNKHGDISLNLSMVRRLHGGNTIKKLYKRRLELDTAGDIYLKKGRTKKLNKEQNEKVRYLF